MTIYSVYCWKERPLGWWSVDMLENTAPLLINVSAASEEHSTKLVSEMYPEYSFFTPHMYKKANGRISQIKMKLLYRINDLTGEIETVEKCYTVVPRKKRVMNETEKIDWYKIGKGFSE